MPHTLNDQAPNIQMPEFHNYAWHGRDGSVYLRFRDIAHLTDFFTSAFVREQVGPDSVNFNDYETNMSLLSLQKKIPLPYPYNPGPPYEAATVA
ncbi:hypothetical protein DM02DRAFT_659207 [Periconia macrospinosa]|uniref:Uncharacterized protein n=1 Tax=Periconia macrospinosa TaxID=97972 RepID=A0A2V1DEL1_9PLEO|nr:hypothetical protein DM02DRAFT_659207 [Periconia macrospinosa]